MRKLVIAAALATLAAINGCRGSTIVESTVDRNCPEFMPGADSAGSAYNVDFSIYGEFGAFGQASADMVAVVGTAREDVTVACKNIATDLGDDPDRKRPGADDGAGLLDFWCGEAVDKIMDSLATTFGLAATGTTALRVDVGPTTCAPLSVIVAVTCEDKCNPGLTNTCDVKGHPPKCIGGRLGIQCAGSCVGSAPAPTIDCTGACDATCTGLCQSSGGAPVPSSGVCAGTCTGTCDGHCSPGPGMTTTKCSGTCSSIDYVALTCAGGKVESGCGANPKCDANCNTSADARASCPAPAVTVTPTAPARAGREALRDVLVTTLEANLPTLLVMLKSRGPAFAGEIAEVMRTADDLLASGKLEQVHGRACWQILEEADSFASSDFDVLLHSSLLVTLAVGIK